MPDNVGYTPGTGATIAADDVGGALHQRVKLTHGIDGSAVDASEASPLPVYDGSVWQMLRRVIEKLSSPAGFDKSLDRSRVTAVVESGTVTTVSTVSTVTTVTTVTTVAGLTNIDGRNGAMLINQSNLSAWADCVRSRIT